MRRVRDLAVCDLGGCDLGGCDLGGCDLVVRAYIGMLACRFRGERCS